jgi:hypothetical protein
MRRALRICGVVIGLAVALGGGVIAVLAFFNPEFTGPDSHPVAAFGSIALAGAGLAQASSRDLFQRIARGAASVVRTFAGRLQLSNPEGLAVWTFVVCAVLLLIPMIRPLVVLLGVLGYLLVSLVYLLIAPRWWYRLGFTLLAGFVIMVCLVGMAEALEPKSIGEGGLGIFAFWFDSLFVLPAAVLLRVLVRTVRAASQ